MYRKMYTSVALSQIQSNSSPAILVSVVVVWFIPSNKIKENFIEHLRLPGWRLRRRRLSLHLAMVRGRHVDELLYAEQRRLILHQILEEVLQMHEQQLHGLLVQIGERQHRAELGEEAQQMERAVQLGHRFVRMQLDDFGVLRPLELVQQLAAEHHVEVTEQAGGDVENGALVVVQDILASLLVHNVRIHNVLHRLLGRQLDQFLLAIDCVPVVDQPRLQFVGDFDADLDFGVELLFGFRGSGQRSGCRTGRRRGGGGRRCGRSGRGAGAGIETGALLPARVTVEIG